MASNEFIRFNEQFPNSKYREIKPQYTGSLDTPDGKSKYQQSKAPINNKILSFDDIINTTNRVGWIVPKEYIVVDVDNKVNARIIFDILQNLKINFSYMTGRKGGHFIFKNLRGVKSISAGMACSLGLTIDIRCNEKGYIVLPENDTDRQWGNITSYVDDIPFFLTPLPNFKPQNNFVNMGEGGRNDALLRHIYSLIDYADELSLDEKCESVRLINKYLLKEPLSDLELQQTVLRDDVINKPKNTKKSTDCLEEKLANRIIKDKNIITGNGICYMYNGKYYKEISSDTELERIIHLEYAPKIKEHTRKEIIKFIKLKSAVNVDDINSKWNELVLRNGILNLTNMTMTPHTPSVYNTSYIDINYKKDATYSSLIDTFFNHLANNNVITKQLLYEIIGYCMLRKNIFQKFFILCGDGGTGKSTYLNLIENLVGVENVSRLSLNDLDNVFMPVEMYGKLVNLGDDIPYKGLKSTSVLKKLVSGEGFLAQRKYKEPIVLKNYAKILFTTNKFPEILDRTTGFWRRVVLVEMNNKIEKYDPLFLDRLVDADYEYLLSKSIDAIIHAMQVGKFTINENLHKMLSQYKIDQSSVLSYLREFDYTDLTIHHIPCMYAYKEYVQFCHDTGFRAVKKIEFDREICHELRVYKRNTTSMINETEKQCWRFVKD